MSSSPAEQTRTKQSGVPELSSRKHGGNMVRWESKQCPQFPCLLSDQIPIEQVTKNAALTQARNMSPNFSHA